jgi:hypothetical protein
MRQSKQSNRGLVAPEKLLPKLLLLTVLKEGYLLLANSYGFLVHPYLTLKKISRDRSQAAIFGSLWLGAWLGVGIVFCLLWSVEKLLPSLAIFVKWGFLLAKVGAAFLLIFSLYLGYWVFVFLRKK